MSEYQKPLPRIGPDSQPFWDAARAHRLQLPYCAECGKPHLPAAPVCPFCLGARMEWRAASGRGTVSSWTRVHKAWFPAFAGDVPYNVIQVELDEGPRLTSSLVQHEDGDLRVGRRVEVVFDDVTHDVTLPRFKPSE